ncbi:hypothetical protein PG997_012791 [Apiospora hydei]|uniref:Heterokaryon incompatibility domain-containing protein n=1 Tax=Apiospora hydei TaxID=1337664 RepID=A0ABR1V4B9_9PEZI
MPLLNRSLAMKPNPFHIGFAYQSRSCRFFYRRSPRAWRHRGVSTSSIYQDLDHTRNEIRLIRISPGQRQDDVSCQLETVSLDRRPKYDTLSYNWGNAQDTSTIYVNDQLVRVSANLLDALRGVRHARKTVTLWADALCIDQSNEGEKSRQVALMGQVYRQGRQTWISLGQPDDGADWANGRWSPSPIADRHVGRLKRLVRGIWRLFWHHLVLHRSRLSRLGVTHVSDAVRLMESLEAKKLGANYQKDGDMAKAMLTWLATHEYWTRVSGINRAREVCMLRDELWSLRPGRQPPLALARTAQLASHRNTSNAHDYIYGLRGLLSPEDQARVPVDYGLSIPELYASATKAMLQKDKSASLLGAAVGIGRKNEHGLASWVLNFSSPVKLPVLRDVHYLCESPLIRPSSELHALTTKSRYLGNHIIATLPRGLTSDDIVDELGSIHQEAGRQVFEQRATEMLCQLLGVGAEAKPKPDILPFLRLLTGPFYKTSLKEGGGRGTPADLPLDEALHELEGSDVGPSVRLLQLSREALRDSATMTEEVVADLQTQLQGIKLEALPLYHAKVLLLFQYRQRGFRGENGRLFRTSEGLLGKCRGNAEPNDEIWALPGSTTAFVLRPVSGGNSPGSNTPRNARYQLVGPCISDGLIVDRDDIPDHTAQYIDII